jgi:hypothetical protein
VKKDALPPGLFPNDAATALSDGIERSGVRIRHSTFHRDATDGEHAQGGIAAMEHARRYGHTDFDRVAFISIPIDRHVYGSRPPIVIEMTVDGASLERFGVCACLKSIVQALQHFFLRVVV